jgi:hypothetical protein
MSDMPNTMKVGMAVGFIGAIIALVAMSMTWAGTVDSAALVGLDMAAAMMFFAVAGTMSSYSPVKASTIVVLSAIAIAFSVVASIYGAMEPICGVILVICGIVCVAVGGMPSTSEYVETNRVI